MPRPPVLWPAQRDGDQRGVSSNLVAVIRASSELTTADGVLVAISPATIGNNSLGTSDGTGYATNPITGLPYTTNLVLRGDFTRSLTEFWADGSSSETPPGHWNSIANHISDDLPVWRVGGVGPAVNRLEWDVKLTFALNASWHDAACAAWSIRRHYQAWRPISVIRHCGTLGQCSNPGLASFHPSGLPLVPDLIELVTEDSVLSGRHAGLTPGKIAVYSSPGQPEYPEDEVSGVHWIHAEHWMPCQKKTFVAPGFPRYISGHSTFSRAAAEVLTAITGSKWFPGGLGGYTLPGLVNEAGPTQPVTLQWASYYDAADQVGLSRIWGGIHPPADAFAGRYGSRVGLPQLRRAGSLAPAGGRLHDFRSVIMVNMLQFTRPPRFAWRFPDGTDDTGGERAAFPIGAIGGICGLLRRPARCGGYGRGTAWRARISGGVRARLKIRRSSRAARR